MRIQRVVFPVVLLLAIGCDKSDKGDAKADKNDRADKAGVTAAKPTPRRGAKAAPVARGELAKWKRHSNAEHGFSVLGPGEPKLLPIPAQPGVSMVTYMFEFTDGSGAGQIAIMKFELDAKGDAGLLDRACKGMVQGVNGTMTKYDEIEIDGKPARSFRFKTVAQNRKVGGIGRCIATAPTALKIVMAFDISGSDNLPKAFVDSFKLTAG